MIFAALLLSLAQDGNRLSYLDESDPYYVHRKFPKLITPQWIGEEGVEAAVVLAIDDMRGHEKWETYLRPILERLKKIDGRAPVSIMTCSIDPNHAQLQKWLKEGLSIEVHTVDHPCPLLKDGAFLKSKSTVDRCIELMNLIPNNRPVAFRMPCCDSLNTLSPRFFAEIFNKTTPGGKFLTIDTSVFNLTTSEDPDLPRELVVDPDGKERIRKYVPFPSFANTIENYPYPYVIGRLCWEFPCAVPSDWEGQYLNKPFSPITVEDMKASIDAVVIKRGVFNFVFHPHGWIKPEQVVELIDHVVAKHGKKVKFLTFREAQDRLEKSFGPLRRPDGGDNGLLLLDVDGDGFMDKVEIRETSIFTTLSSVRMAGSQISTGVGGVPPGTFEGRFGILRKGGSPTLLTKTKAWTFGKDNWATDAELGRLQSPSARLLDLDGDGICEQVSNDGVFQLDGEWKRLPFRLPAPLTDAKGRDNGVRFVDLNGDGRPDIVYSTDNDYGVFVFKDMSAGWEKIPSGPIPMITREGTNNGAWFHSKHLWVQNEDTAKMKDLVDRRSYEDLLQKK